MFISKTKFIITYPCVSIKSLNIFSRSRRKLANKIHIYSANEKFSLEIRIIKVMHSSLGTVLIKLFVHM